MEEQAKYKHGGYRPGAGRHKDPDGLIPRFTFRCSDAAYEEIKLAAETEDKSVNQYLIDAALERRKHASEKTP